MKKKIDTKRTNAECDVSNVRKQCGVVGAVRLGNIRKLGLVRLPNQQYL